MSQNLDNILKNTAADTGVCITVLLGGCHSEETKEARNKAMRAVHNDLHWSKARIARKFSVSRSTVSRAVRKA